jgi:hypothetical protein
MKEINKLKNTDMQRAKINIDGWLQSSDQSGLEQAHRIFGLARARISVSLDYYFSLYRSLLVLLLFLEEALLMDHACILFLVAGLDALFGLF